MSVHLCDKDIDALYKYAKEVPENGTIVDIGTAAGGSAFVMAMASKSSVKVITIDPVVNKDFTNNREQLFLEDKITFKNETSKSVFKEWNKTKKIDMVFIDGIHSYEGVLSDLKSFGSLLTKDGIIAIHDIFLYDNTIGLLVDQLVNNHELKHIEVVDDIWNDGRRIGMFIGKKYEKK